MAKLINITVVLFLLQMGNNLNYLYASSGKIDIQDTKSSVINLNYPKAKVFSEQEKTKIHKRNIIDSDGWIRVGVLLPLSGKAAIIGKSLKQAAEIALFSSGNNKMILQFYDTNNVLMSVKEITKQAVSERVDVIVGPLFGKEVYDVARVARSYDIPVISFSNDEKSLNSAKVYSINYLISQEIDQLIGFASSKGHKTISIIIPEDENNDMISDAIKNTIYKYSGKIHKLGQYKKSDQISIAEAVKQVTDYQDRSDNANKIRKEIKKQLEDLSCNNLNDTNTTQTQDDINDNEIKKYCDNLNKLDKSLLTIKALGKPNFDTIFVYGDVNDLISIGSYLLYYDISKSSVKIIGTSALDNRKIFTEHGYYGAWFTGKNNMHAKSFENEYAGIFNDNPSNLAMLAYDVISVIANTSKDGRFELEKLNNPGGFFGISGLFRFADDGIVNRSFEIKEIAPNRSRIILPSAKSFNEMNMIIQNNIIKGKSSSNLDVHKRVDFDWIAENLKSLSIEDLNTFLIE